MSDKAHTEREHFFGAAKIMAALTMLSRVFGLFRDMAIWAFGASRATDSFWVAFSIPNLFRRLFGEGALSAAFVPVFTEVAEADGWDKARRVLANTAGLLATVLAALIVIGEAILLALLLWAPGEWDRTLMLQLTMIVLPFMFTICLLALGSAALNCKGHFAYPAFAPILLNLFMISAALCGHRMNLGDSWRGLFLLSGSVLAAGVVQLVGVVWLLRSSGLAAMPRLRPLLAEVRKIARLILPTMIPLGILQFSAFFDRMYAWWMTAAQEGDVVRVFGLATPLRAPLEEGVVTCLYAAGRLYQFPMGILAISLATAVFPLFSRYASRNDVAGLRDATNRALRLSLFMGLPAGVALAVLAQPVAELICRHGKFTARDVDRVAYILRMYCLGMWAYFCNHILLRAFFSQKDTVTPLKVSCGLVGVNMLLVITLVFTPLRAGAIGLATAVTAAATTLLLTWILRRRWGRIGLRRILASLARTVAATAAMSGVLWIILVHLHPFAAQLARHWQVRWADEAVVVLTAVPAGAVTYFLAARLLRCTEIRELLGAVQKRSGDD